MKNFKIGQNVIFRDPEKRGMAGICNVPNEGEIVTIEAKCDIRENAWDLLEYPVDKAGRPQSFVDTFLFPIEDQGTFAKEALKDAYIEHLEEEIKELKRELQKQFA